MKKYYVHGKVGAYWQIRKWGRGIGSRERGLSEPVARCREFVDAEKIVQALNASEMVTTDG